MLKQMLPGKPPHARSCHRGPGTHSNQKLKCESDSKPLYLKVIIVTFATFLVSAEKRVENPGCSWLVSLGTTRGGEGCTGRGLAQTCPGKRGSPHLASAGLLTLSAADARPGRGSPGVERGGPQGRAGHHAVGSLAGQLGSSVLQPGHRLPQVHLGGGPRWLVPPRPGRGQAAAEQRLGSLRADAAVGGLAVAVRCGAKGTDSGWVRNERGGTAVSAPLDVPGSRGAEK